jgi:predicted dehydrogenase
MPEADGTIGWLLVGTGDLARKRVAAALANAPGNRLIGVVGQADRAATLAREWRVAAYADLDAALANPDVHAVYVATPVDRHANDALAAIRHGRHVLVEKPLGLSAADARRVVNAAEAANVTAGCAYYRRCTPRYAHAADLLRRGELGRLVAVNMHYRAWYDPDPSDPKHWRVDPVRSGGGPLSDIGSHMVDVVVGLFGMPRAVFAKAATLVHRYPVEDSASVVMGLAGGATVNSSFHWNSKTWAHVMEIIGSEASLRWGPYDSGPVVLTRGREAQEIDLPHAPNAHEPLVVDFVAAIRAGRPPAVPAAEALKTNLLLDAVYESSRAGTEVLL